VKRRLSILSLFLITGMAASARAANGTLGVNSGGRLGAAYGGFGVLGAAPGTNSGGGGGGGSVPKVDLLLDFGGASVGVFTTNRLFDGSHTNGWFCFPAIQPDPQVRNIVTNDFGWPLLSAVSVGGTQYSGDDGKSAKFFLTGAAAFHDGRFDFRTNANGARQGQMNLTFAFRVEPSTLLSDSIDLVQMTGSGEYMVANLDMSNPTNLRIEGSTNFGAVAQVAVIQSNFWYWCSLSWDTNVGPTGFGYCELRNGTNGAFIARAGLGLNSKQMVEYVRFGREDHSYTAANAVRFDNFMIRTNQTGGAATNWVWQ
jgi:hypothetical protein